DAGEGMVGAWTELEPIVRKLTSLVRQRVDVGDFDGKEALMLLRECAGVAARVSQAATGVLRASEGQVRLAVLLEGPKPTRKEPGAMTEKQLVGVVLAMARRLKEEQGGCPVCAPPAIPVESNGKGPEEGAGCRRIPSIRWSASCAMWTSTAQRAGFGRARAARAGTLCSTQVRTAGPRSHIAGSIPRCAVPSPLGLRSITSAECATA